MKDTTLQPAAIPIERAARAPAPGRRVIAERIATRQVQPQTTTLRLAPPPLSMPPRPRHPESDDLTPQPARGSERASLEATLKRAARGDETAWRDLVETYSTRVFGLIRAQCNNSDLAEEITQSTFCTVVAKIAEYTELGKFEQWLFRIAMNRLRDEMRRRKRQARPVEDEALIGLAGAAEDQPRPSGSIGGPGRIDPAEVIALRQAVAQLSDADQQIIHLRHYGGLSFKQIAEILDQPLGTVLARQHRALKKLHELLGGPDE